MSSKSFLTVVLALLACGILDKGPGVMGEEVYVIVGPELKYYPSSLEINVGDTVVWRWAYPLVPGSTPHTVTKSISFDKKCVRVADYQKKSQGIDISSGIQLSGYEYRYTFTKVDHVTYHCETTPVNCDLGMWGEIFVVPSGARTEKIDLSKYKLQADLLTSIAVDNNPIIQGLTSIFGK